MYKTYSDFETSKAAKMILAEVIRFGSSFNDAWDHYNDDWHKGRLSNKDKEETRNFILDVFDKLCLQSH